MKNHRKILLIFLGLSIVALLFLMVQIYAKYLTAASGDTSMAVAKWNISVNNLSIKNNSDISSAIIPVFPGNDNIAKDVIAPTAEGYFDLNLDFSDADVSFKYEITTSVSENSSVKDLVTTGYSVDDGKKITFTDFNSSIEDTISLADNIEKRKIRIYVLWNDDETTQTMTNVEDTASTKSEIPALFNVKLSFTQIAE